MAWLTIDKNKDEYIHKFEPILCFETKIFRNRYNYDDIGILMPKGAVYKLIDKELTWRSKPIEI